MNKKKTKKGFTLVELLAVIVILAIILVIAVPKIMSTIEEARKGAFESTAKLIAAQAERKKLENDTLGITEKIECNQVVKLNSSDYASCDIRFETDGTAKVTIVGQGKFEGMQIIDATKTEAKVTETGSSEDSDKIETPLKFGRAYSAILEENGGEITISYVFYEDGSVMMFDGVRLLRAPAGMATYSGNKVSGDGLEGIVSEDGTKIDAYSDETLLMTLELSDSPIYFGMPYSYSVEDTDGVTHSITFVFYPNGAFSAYVDGELQEDYEGLTYESDSIILSNGNNLATVSVDGTKINIYDDDEILYPLELIENPVYFGERYSAIIEENGTTYEQSVIFSKSGVAQLFEDDESTKLSALVTYLDGYVILDGGITTVSSDKTEVTWRRITYTLDTVEREVIPAGATYTTGLVFDEESGTWDETNKKTYTEGEYFPTTPKLGDIYTYGDYEYRYKAVWFLTWIPSSAVNYVSQTGWGVIVRNLKSSYEPMLSTITGEPVTNAVYTYAGVTTLKTAPTIPDSVTHMVGTFAGCTSLETVASLPKNVTNMSSTFNGCTSLKTAPAIPSSVTDMSYTFMDCTSLETAPAIPSSVTSMSSTFSGCTSLETAPAIPSSVTSMSSTFSGCTSLKTAPDMSNATSVTDMSGTFKGCTSLETALAIPSSVTDMSSTFSGCTSLKTAPDMSNATSITNMLNTFFGCTLLERAPAIPSSVTDMTNTFYDCTSLKTAPDMSNATSVTNMSGTFRGCTSLETVTSLPKNVTNMSYTFKDCTLLETAPAIPSGVTSMFETFSGCTSLTGTIEINTNTTFYLGMLYNTQITQVIGSTPYKTEILATR